MKKSLMLMAAFAAAALMSVVATAAPAHYDPGGIPAAWANKSTQSSVSFPVVKAEPGAVQAVAVKDVSPVSIIQSASKGLNGGGSGSSPVHVGGPSPGGGIGDNPAEHPQRLSRGGEGFGYAHSHAGDGANGTFSQRS